MQIRLAKSQLCKMRNSQIGKLEEKSYEVIYVNEAGKVSVYVNESGKKRCMQMRLAKS